VEEEYCWAITHATGLSYCSLSGSGVLEFQFQLDSLAYTGCPGGNVPDIGRMFLKLKYTDITKNTYI